jgi:hypothetical protein
MGYLVAHGDGIGVIKVFLDSIKIRLPFQLQFLVFLSSCDRL